MSGLFQVRVAACRDEALGIRSIDLVSATGGALPPFTAGAHVDMHLPCGLVRPCPLCNDPRETHRCLLGVLREPAPRGGSAGGIGITPTLAMAETPAAESADVRLHHNLRRAAHAACADRLRAYGNRAQRHTDDSPTAQKLDAAAACTPCCSHARSARPVPAL